MAQERYVAFRQALSSVGAPVHMKLTEERDYNIKDNNGMVEGTKEGFVSIRAGKGTVLLDSEQAALLGQLLVLHQKGNPNEGC